MTAPLRGVRVLDLAEEPGIFATRILADLGADVVRIEPPGGGRVRGLAPFLGSEPGVERSLQHLYHNANKRSAIIDLGTEEGRADVRALCETADVLVETAPPGRMAEMGLGYPELSSRNAGLVYVSITPFGQSGPWSARKSGDLVAAAAGGLLWVSGHTDDPPTLAGGDQSLKMASLVAVAGALAALTGRDADPSARGAHVDVSMQEAVAMSVVQTSQPNHYVWHGRIPHRPGLTAVHRCADGKYVAPFMSRNRVPTFLDWVRSLGLPCEETDESLGDAEQLALRAHPLFRAVAASLVRDDFLREAWRRDIWVLPVLSLSDMLTCDHLVQTRQFRDVASEPTGSVLSFPRSPVDAVRPDLEIRRAPRLGEHTAEVLREVRAKRPGPPARADRSDGARPRPLSGIRVLDFCWVLAGPLGSRILANLGAEVIRVAPSPDRWLADFFPPGIHDAELGAFHNLVDTAKRSITVDPRTPKGRDILRGLADRCDVITDNYRPGALDRMGLGYDAISRTNPGVVMLHLPGCGSTGPWAERPTLGNMVVAASGISHLTGFPKRSPRGMGVAYPDFTSPYLLATCVMAALRRRRATGAGAELDLSQLSATISLIGVEWLEFTTTSEAPSPRSNRDPNYCPHGAYACRGDDEWIAIAVEGDDEFASLAALMQRPELAGDDRFATHRLRKLHEDDLDAVVRDWTKQHDRWDLADSLQSAGIAAAAVENVRDALERDPHLADHYVRVRRPEHPDVEIVVQREAVRFAATDWELVPAPGIGADNASVLLDVLGLSGEELAALYSERVVL